MHITRSLCFLGQSVYFFRLIFSIYIRSRCLLCFAHFCLYCDSNELNQEEINISIAHIICLNFHFLKLFLFVCCVLFSFVQEFVAAPLDGVSLLLEVLRSIQLSQQTTINQDTIGKVTAQTYQRRALLDELACL